MHWGEVSREIAMQIFRLDMLVKSMARLTDGDAGPPFVLKGNIFDS